MAKELSLEAGEWFSFLDKVQDKTSQAIKYLKAIIGTEGFKNIAQHFEDEESPQGKWVSLKESTLLKRTKGKSGGSPKILQDTGALRQSILPGTGRMKVIGGDAIQMLAGTIYSRVHDEGYPRRNIPQREFMWLSDETLQLMANYVRDQIAGA